MATYEDRAGVPERFSCGCCDAGVVYKKGDLCPTCDGADLSHVELLVVSHIFHNTTYPFYHVYADLFKDGIVKTLLLKRQRQLTQSKERYERNH